MRRACVLRKLGRCAGQSPRLSTSQCGPEAISTASRPLRRDLAGALYAQSRPFNTTSSHPREENKPWRLAPAQPPSVHPHPHHDAAFDTLPRPEKLRAVMRLLPHSVVVCTSSSPPSSTPLATITTTTTTTPTTVPRGMTMSSFTSLTLHPTPLVTFNCATPSRTLDTVERSGRFNIHVLSGDAAGGRVAEWFRRGNDEGLGVFDAEGMREGCGCECECEVVMHKGKGKGEDGRQNGDDGGEVGDEGEGIPLLRGPGVMYVLRCRLLDDEPLRGLVRVRDRVIVVAEVVDIVEGGDREGDEPFGLVYADRRYRQLGGTLVPGGD